MRDISLYKKNPNTQKPLKNKNSRTQTIHPSQDTRRANVSLGRDRRNWIFSIPWLPACRTSTNWPRASLRKARPWLSHQRCEHARWAVRMLELSERKWPVPFLAGAREPLLASSGLRQREMAAATTALMECKDRSEKS